MTPPVPTPDDRRWAQLAKQVQFTQLTEVRAQAEKWRTGLTSSAAVVGVVLAVAAPFIGTSAASSGVRAAIGGTAVAATALLGFGAWMAMLASFGTPVAINSSGESLKTTTRERATTAVKQLRVARATAATGTVLLAVTAAIGFFCTTTSANGGVVVTGDGQTLCGTVTTEAEGKKVKVRAYDGTIYTVEVADLKSLQLGAKC